MQRVTRRRIIKRKAATLQQIVSAHVRAGDEAYANHLYSDAAQHYRDALALPTITAADENSISEKLAYALSLGGNPEAASPFFDRVLSLYLDKPGSSVKTVELLLQQARHLWIDSKTKAALPLLSRAIHIAKENKHENLFKFASSRMANYLLVLNRYEEAETFLCTVGDVSNLDDAALRAVFYVPKAMIAAASGKASEAFEYFERAVAATKEGSDVVHITSVWTAYCFGATVLGNIELAKVCCERALLVARQYHIVWRIPELCLIYASLLGLLGQYSLAREYVSDALAYDAHAAISDIIFVEAGIPLALHFNDRVMLARCARPSAIEFAFRAGAAESIANVAASFAQMYATSRRMHESQALLHRAIEAIGPTGRIDELWTFPIVVARFGSDADVATVRKIIKSRAALPSAEVAFASLELFDAFIAQRDERADDTRRHAVNAARRFEALGWRGYVDLAQTLLPSMASKRTVMAGTHEPFSDMLSVLTVRERQVANFVLRGLTNHAIAAELSITENTVEKHMTSIMNRLGIRSRHQLAGAVEGGP